MDVAPGSKDTETVVTGIDVKGKSTEVNGVKAADKQQASVSVEMDIVKSTPEQEDGRGWLVVERRRSGYFASCFLEFLLVFQFGLLELLVNILVHVF